MKLKQQVVLLHITSTVIADSSQYILHVDKTKNPLFRFFWPEKQFWPCGIQVQKELLINLSDRQYR